MSTSPLQICKARHFRGIGESQYSAYRRYLIANPNLSLVNLDKYLRDIEPDVKPGARIPKHENHENTGVKINLSYWRKNGPKKHCPLCAASLFHSDYYEADWLECCPIHDVKLTTLCPQCHKPWLNVIDLAKSLCPVCGRARIKDLSPQKMLPKLNTERLSELHDRLRIPETVTSAFLLNETALYDQSPYMEYWGLTDWRDSSYRPIMENLRAVTQSKNQRIDNLKSSHEVCFYESSISEITVSRLYSMNNTSKLLDVLKDHRNESFYKAGYRAMTEILRSINCVTPKKHKACVFNFYGLNHYNFIRRPNICPYCMSLSLWFTLLADYFYYGSSDSPERDYPFFKEYNFRCPTMPTPFVVSSKNKTYKMARKLSITLYQRALESLFVILFKFCLEINKATLSQTGYSDLWRFYDRIYALKNSTSMTFTWGNKFFFFASPRKPLNEIEGYRVSCKDCQKNRNLLPKGKLYAQSIDELIGYDNFLKLNLLHQGVQYDEWPNRKAMIRNRFIRDDR